MYELVPKPQQIPEELSSKGVVADVRSRFEFYIINNKPKYHTWYKCARSAGRGETAAHSDLVEPESDSGGRIGGRGKRTGRRMHRGVASRDAGQ